MIDPIDRLWMPQSAMADLVKAVPDQLVKEIVADHYRRAAPTQGRAPAWGRARESACAPAWVLESEWVLQAAPP